MDPSQMKSGYGGRDETDRGFKQRGEIRHGSKGFCGAERSVLNGRMVSSHSGNEIKLSSPGIILKRLPKTTENATNNVFCLYNYLRG